MDSMLLRLLQGLFFVAVSRCDVIVLLLVLLLRYGCFSSHIMHDCDHALRLPSPFAVHWREIRFESMVCTEAFGCP